MDGSLLAIAVGLGSGVLSGTFGIGGGLVTTPAIRLLLARPELIAVGTPLPVILPGALTGAFVHARRGSADIRAGLAMGAAGALASVAGALLSDRVGGTVVLLATAAVIVWAAADMLMQAWSARSTVDALGAEIVAGDAESDEGAVPPLVRGRGAAATWRLIAIGLVAGLYSGFLGLGGGFVVVPALTRYCGFTVKRAIGTSLVVVAALAIPGSVAHGMLGHIDWALAALLAIGVVPGAVLGARLAHRASDRSLRVAFAVLLIVVGVWLAANELPGVPL